MTKFSMQAEPKQQLNRLQREVLDTLCIEIQIKRSAALTKCISETLSSLARAGVEDSARTNPYGFARRTKVLKGIWSVR